MIDNLCDFARDLKQQGIDLEENLGNCKEIVLDYQWAFKPVTAKPVNGEKIKVTGSDYKRYITIYVDGRETAQVYLSEGPLNEKGAREILREASGSLRKSAEIPKSADIRGTYLGGHGRQEKDLGSLS
jgi:hypothetical protein